jgi:hypothetical protein
MDEYTLFSFRKAYCTFWFHEGMLRVRGFIGTCNDMGTFPECLLYIATVDVLQGEQVAILMYLWRFRFECLVDIENRGE